MEIILYSTGCPKCQVLKKKLDAKNIEYILCDDQNKMKAENIDKVPVLKINGEKLNFKAAVDYVNELGV